MISEESWDSCDGNAALSTQKNIILKYIKIEKKKHFKL